MNSEALLLAALALFVLVSVFLMAQQVVRERGTQTDNERLHHENELLRRENTMLTGYVYRLTTQVENMEGIPIVRIPNGTTITREKDPVLYAMQNLFTREELMLLADDAGLDYDHITAGSLPAIALQLADQAKHRGVEVRLRDAVKRARPNSGL